MRRRGKCRRVADRTVLLAGRERTGDATGALCRQMMSDGQEESGDRDENEQESSGYPEQTDISIHEIQIVVVLD